MIITYYRIKMAWEGSGAGTGKLFKFIEVFIIFALKLSFYACVDFIYGSDSHYC